MCVCVCVTQAAAGKLSWGRSSLKHRRAHTQMQMHANTTSHARAHAHTLTRIRTHAQLQLQRSWGHLLPSPAAELTAAYTVAQRLPLHRAGTTAPPAALHFVRECQQLGSDSSSSSSSRKQRQRQHRQGAHYMATALALPGQDCHAVIVMRCRTFRQRSKKHSNSSSNRQQKEQQQQQQRSRRRRRQQQQPWSVAGVKLPIGFRVVSDICYVHSKLVYWKLE